ncbi:thioredoxin family protein [Cohnella nanjingensis]|uniref:Thioredoxin n=1 Tax=Cohnella nanjingensis TaxID=1387779 RepID=A0A7X0RSB0_9BACL|nr:thioredoxin family protein [Cohnella nanjingensis]MBB6672777.1 thioredoxin family protein [Cohnella nanjingensis]
MKLTEVNDQSFKEHVRPLGVTLVDFSTTWCPPCKALMPVLEELADAYGSQVSMLKVDCDDSPETASAFGVMANPTVIVFRDGEPAEKLVGLRPSGAYRAVLDRHLVPDGESSSARN